MEDTSTSSRALNAVILLGALVVVIGLVWWLWLAATDAEPVTSLASTQRATEPNVEGTATLATPTVDAPPREWAPVLPSDPVLFDDDLGTGSTEFSAVTLNEDTNRLMVIDDEGHFFEFDLDDGGAPVRPARRTITSQFDDRDIEGIAWISDTTYALAHEVTGRLSIIEIADAQTRLDESNVQRTVDTQVRDEQGNGIEGVTKVETIDDVEFIVAVEDPPTLVLMSDDGVPTDYIPLRLGVADVADVADVFAASDGTVWVVSDIGRAVFRLEITADGAVRELQELDLVFPQGRFEQPEGLALTRDGTRLYVVGESPGAGQFVLGIWSLD